VTAPDFQFPLLTIRPKPSSPAQELIDDLDDLWSVYHWKKWMLEDRTLVGMLLFDCSGRCWRISDVQDLGVEAAFWRRMFGWVLPLTHRVACDFVELDPVPLEALKDRVCTAIVNDPDSWRDDEAIAGEDGPPQDEQVLLAELQARVRRARSVPQIINALCDDPRGDGLSPDLV